ncbi:uncharacterized protein LOC116297394 isoform X2 [Actinia tenebrosa]|uniref:Uncharacterized protein LOC116297394 isoform X2 n=1 Tax=Actinia tenebrosa TaxID=6105 RepID=A0A6P8I157_ACTTE|nr:uncharacterized protein LOC116297394 isoform X2 [Actinia tenebrosa]
MKVLGQLKLYFTRFLALLAGTHHGEISKTILCVTTALYLACQIVVVLNRDQCSAKVLAELSRANERLHRVESTLETLEHTVVGLLKDKGRTRGIVERVVRSTHGRAGRQATRRSRNEIRYLKRKMKSLEKRLLSLNKTNDSEGRRCIHLDMRPAKDKIKNNMGTKEPKTPKQEASGRDNQSDSSKSSSSGKQADQRKKQTTKRKTSRRNTVFTRWGRTQCRTSNKSRTSLVYSGRVAASHYTHKGGGSNYLCLPERALYTNQGNISEDQSAHLYPVKYGKVMNTFYKFSPNVLKNFSPADQKRLTASFDFMDVPCAVCRVDGATSVLMIPARNVCPRTGDRQYHGYLMSQKHDYGKSEFICVDVEAEGIPNTRNPNGDAFLHLTEFKCGSPSCRGYQQHKALSCSVCTE